ncbi:hypothetical protein ABZ897_50155 [Nonomuraea sp. NPDC046802]|uniref:hypothetical protein n=1 Tax=Nonomuraea sp. NPDC046802 TaxID=3154919 RepID=UPI0033E84105
MSGYAFLFFAGAGVLLVLGFVNQRKLWWSTTAWQYRNPKANEPSDASLDFGRVLSLLGAFLAVVCGLIAWSYDANQEQKAARRALPIIQTPTPDPVKARTYSLAEVREKAEAVAAKVVGRHHDEVPAIIVAESDGNLRHKTLDRHWEGVWTIRGYDLTNREDEHPICMTTREYTSPVDLTTIESAETTAGPC